MNSLIPATPDVLYHFTCEEHGHPGIQKHGMIGPGGDGLVWLTDLEFPFRNALGLTRVSLSCDRGAVRYRVDDTKGIMPWMEFRRGLQKTEIVRALEMFPGAMPRHWFVGTEPVKAVHDPLRERES